MSFWDDTLTATIFKASAVSTTADGDPGYGPRTPAAARVQFGRDRNSEEIAHTAVIYTSVEILPTDRVWLPGDALTDAAARRPVQTYKTYDLDSQTDVLFKTLL